MYRIPVFTVAALLCVWPLAFCALAQDKPNALLSPADTQTAASHVVELMDLTSAAIPGLSRASEPLRQNTQATAAALRRTLRDSTLTLDFINELRAYLALADSLPRPDYFPATASEQFLELRQEQQNLGRHFQALLVQARVEERAREADPSDLKHYAAANLKITPPTPSLPRFVFLGDSIIESWRMSDYFTGKDFVNRGIAGQTTAQILSRFLADVVALHPSAVFVLAGTGDLAAGIPLSAIADNLVMIGDVAKAHSVLPVFGSLLPVSGEAAKVRTPDVIRKLNTWIRNYCIRENFIYVDYYTPMADSKGMMKAGLSDDGVNPNSRGYRVMVPIVLDGVERVREMTASSSEDISRERHRGLFLNLR